MIWGGIIDIKKKIIINLMKINMNKKIYFNNYRTDKCNLRYDNVDDNEVLKIDDKVLDKNMGWDDVTQKFLNTMKDRKIRMKGLGLGWWEVVSWIEEVEREFIF